MKRASRGTPTIAAFFDVDGTLARTNIVRYYAHFRMRGRSGLFRALWTLSYLPQVARWLALDAIDRQRFARTFYRQYAGMRVEPVRAAAVEDYATLLGNHVFPAARARVADHRRREESVVFVTGSLDFIVDPLMRDLEVDDLIAATMRTDGDHFTGELETTAPNGVIKQLAIEAWAARHNVALAMCWAYGDSCADLPMLQAVGHPVAVNPDRQLRRVAVARGWVIENWQLGVEPDRARLQNHDR